MLVAGNFAWVPHVKLPVKCPCYSGKFTCACRQFACILREVLAASTQVSLPVFTGKLYVTQVNCVWDFFTCELHVKLPAFAGNFARASFTVWLATFRSTELNYCMELWYKLHPNNLLDSILEKKAIEEVQIKWKNLCPQKNESSFWEVSSIYRQNSPTNTNEMLIKNVTKVKISITLRTQTPTRRSTKTTHKNPAPEKHELPYPSS